MPRGKQKKIELPEYYIRLKDIRISLGLEITQMAALIDIPEVTYLYYELGYVLEIPMDVLVKFSRRFEVSVDYLVGLTDIPDRYSNSEEANESDVLDTSRVRECRIEHGETGKTMSQHLDINQGAYSRKELHPDDIKFNLPDLIRIAYFFNTSIDYLVKLTNERIPHDRGTHKKVALGVGKIRSIKHALGLVLSPAQTKDEVKSYCAEHFRVKICRKSRGFTQQEVADAIDMDRATYSMQERNPYRFSAYYLIKLADFFGTTVDYLVGRTDVE